MFDFTCTGNDRASLRSWLLVSGCFIEGNEIVGNDNFYLSANKFIEALNKYKGTHLNVVEY
jgi:hypothetical protein